MAVEAAMRWLPGVVLTIVAAEISVPVADSSPTGSLVSAVVGSGRTRSVGHRGVVVPGGRRRGRQMTEKPVLSGDDRPQPDADLER